MTDKLKKSTSSTPSTEKTQGLTLESKLARAVIERVVLDLTSQDDRERGDAAKFFLSGDYVYYCNESGIDPDWLRSNSTGLLSLNGVQRKRAAKDLIEQIKNT